LAALKWSQLLCAKLPFAGYWGKAKMDGRAAGLVPAFESSFGLLVLAIVHKLQNINSRPEDVSRMCARERPCVRLVDSLNVDTETSEAENITAPARSRIVDWSATLVAASIKLLSAQASLPLTTSSLSQFARILTIKVLRIEEIHFKAVGDKNCLCKLGRGFPFSGVFSGNRRRA
jgi:hypothetical protein